MPSTETNPNNFRFGLSEVDIPELGPKRQGKVRDIWPLSGNRLALVTTDRLSAFDSVICTVPGKGAALNLTAAYWFNWVKDEMSHLDVRTHLIAVPHPNVMIVKQAEATLPVEMVLRSHMARSSTSTSVNYNYFKDNPNAEDVREIYGQRFPAGLKPNQEFPQTVGFVGTVVTPTTKAEKGAHDAMLTLAEASALVDNQFGYGTWYRVMMDSIFLYKFASKHLREKGLIMADTKLEWGINRGKPVLIDEVFTPDSSRFWRVDTYNSRFTEGRDPHNFDKEIVRRYLAEECGYRGEGIVPDIPDEVLNATAQAYRQPYERITGQSLPDTQPDVREIRKAVLAYR